MTRSLPLLLTTVALLASTAHATPGMARDPMPVAVTAQDAAQTKPKREPIYDEAADAEQLVEAALSRAQRDHKRVLLMYGGNWCGWCYRLDDTLHSDPDVAHEMLYEYELVHVDIGHGEKHAELSARFGSDHKAHGYPYLTVIDEAGHTVAHQDTGELEDGAGHDPAKVLAFLRANQATPPAALDVLADAMQRAKAEDKRLFVHLGAPWCGWCRRLEAWMARPEVAALLAREFIDVKIDVDRMAGATTVASLLRRGDSGGIPWCVFTDAALRPLADSDGPDGNIGFPVSAEEIAHFVSMLRAARQHLDDADIAALKASLEASAKSIQGANAAH